MTLFSLILIPFLSCIFSADAATFYNGNESLYCDANSAEHVTQNYPPWMAQLFVSKSEDKRSMKNVTVFEYPVVSNPICMGVIIKTDLILISRSCYFKAQDMILHQDPIPNERQELVVLTGVNPESPQSKRFSVVFQEKSMICDKAGLVIMVLLKPLVFSDYVFHVTIPAEFNKLKRKKNDENNENINKTVHDLFIFIITPEQKKMKEHPAMLHFLSQLQFMSY